MENYLLYRLHHLELNDFEGNLILSTFISEKLYENMNDLIIYDGIHYIHYDYDEGWNCELKKYVIYVRYREINPKLLDIKELLKLDKDT